MNAAPLGRASSFVAASGVYRGSTIQPRDRPLGRPVDAGRGRTHVGDRPLDRIVYDRAHDRIGPETSDDVDRPVLEADRTRQRDDISPDHDRQRHLVGQQAPAARDQRGAQRALPGSRRGGEDQCAAGPLDDRGVDHQVLVTMRRDAPVQPPLEQWETPGPREGAARGRAVERRIHQGLQPAPDAAGGPTATWKSAKGRRNRGSGAPRRRRRPRDEPRCRPDLGDQRAQRDSKPGTLQPRREVDGTVADELKPMQAQIEGCQSVGASSGIAREARGETGIGSASATTWTSGHRIPTGG